MLLEIIPAAREAAQDVEFAIRDQPQDCVCIMLLVVEPGPPQLNLLKFQSVIYLDVTVTCG